MPPPETHKTLGPREKALLERWIREGAEYEPHWAFVAPVRPPLPAVARRSVVSATRSITSSRAAGAGRAYARAGGRSRDTLLRRVTLDLTGLPPTPAEIDAFVARRHRRTLRRVVDRLLASPHYGERLAADTGSTRPATPTRTAIHIDDGREMWPYRDWVIARVQPQHAVRSVHDRATRRRSAAQRRRSTSRSRPASTAQHAPRTKAASSTRSIA